jgi:hypothetical protein
MAKTRGKMIQPFAADVGCSRWVVRGAGISEFMEGGLNEILK